MYRNIKKFELVVLATVMEKNLVNNEIYICCAFLKRRMPIATPPHPTYNVVPVYQWFFRTFNIVLGRRRGGGGLTVRYHCF